MLIRRQSGFTLIELLIVVVVIGILFAVAFPSYLQYARKSRRAECQTVMLSYANALERRFAVKSSYDEGGAMEEDFGSCPAEGGTQTYKVDFESSKPTAFKLTATPKNDQTHDKCGILTLDQTGKKGNNASVPTSECW